MGGTLLPMTAQTAGTRRGPAHPASVRLTAAKGRPMLSWVGKRPLREVRAFPAQLVERFSASAGAGGAIGPSATVDWSDWPERYERGGLLFHGDNKEVLAHLLANGFRGKVDLVYIDPPFDSGADYVRRVQLRGASGTARLDGENYTLGEQIQYTDIWANDTYLQFMYERLLLLKELLSARGSLYLHCDPRRSAMLRLVLDEVLGVDNFRNEVVWCYTGPSNQKSDFPDKHDVILRYTKSDAYAFNSDAIRIPYVKLETGKTSGIFKDPATLNEAGKIPEDWWTDITPVARLHASELLDFPTQKPEALLRRIVASSSNPGDIVLDCFIGSGTTAAVAQKLGRRWIGADINKGAIQTTIKRLAGVMEEQAAASVNQQQTLTDDDGAAPPPAQLSFTTWRVNDYDLAIQHNEAVNLACEHLGVDRTRTDPFFDGTLGRRLVKIVPFNHPATVLDLQDAARELESRPGEERDAVLVALGREVRTVDWLADYNGHRPINRLEVIELRSDPKYGKFFEHRPASARVRLELEPPPDADAPPNRLDGPVRARVVIEDFISPSILERLSQTDGVLAPQITDWRSMVDSVMIDTAYDGEVFNVVVADIPERRTDLVAGSYDVELPWEAPYRPVAVKITDMLGEEILVVLDR